MAGIGIGESEDYTSVKLDLAVTTAVAVAANLRRNNLLDKGSELAIELALTSLRNAAQRSGSDRLLEDALLLQNIFNS